MKLTGLLLTRNSDWIIGLSLRSMLLFCDSVVVLMHNCTDRTAEIVREIAVESDPRVFILIDGEAKWDEMRLRQKMLDHVRLDGATHLWLQDDDEVLTANLLPSIRDHVERTPTGTILQLPWLCLRDGIDQMISTGMWGQQNVSCACKDDPAWHWKPQGAEGYEHHHRHPMGRQFVPQHIVGHSRMRGGLMHLQFASRRRLLAKQAWYQAVERLRWPDRPMPDYRRTVRESEAGATTPVPDSWWAAYRSSGLLEHLRLDAEPWQEAELHRLVAEHGRERFAGCDFFGVI